MILTIRTYKPEAELGIYDGNKKLAYETWQAHRQLAESMHTQIAKILQFVGKELSEIDGIVVFQGPGSFTGLRIGISVANALSYSLQAPIVGTSGDDWILTGITQLKDATIGTLVVPRYGSEARITAQKK